MSRPRLRTDGDFLPGLAAVALFVVLSAVFLGAPLSDPTGFGADAAVMKSLGAALFDLDPGTLVGDGSPVPSEGFLVAFEIVDVALVAALVGAVMLARRDEDAGDGPAPDGEDSTGSDQAAATDGGTEQ